MITIPNQSSVAKTYTEFEDDGRSDYLAGRYSERKADGRTAPGAGHAAAAISHESAAS